MRPLRIGTRGSALALWQARAVATALEQHDVPAELVTISTRGDQKQDLPLAAMGGKGVFVKEIHEALLSGEIDLAVHSAKDMPAVSPEGLTIGAVLAREDPRDALVLPGTNASALHTGDLQTRLEGPTLIGTGSPRRIAQLRRIFPQARFDPIRGNVDTRLRKLDAGEAQALVLACAGLRRLGLAHRITTAIEVSDCVPAPGQGIIAIEARGTDDRVLERLDALNNPPARIALAAEQAVVAELGGGCQLPLGAFAQVSGLKISIRAIAASTSGTAIIESTTTGDANNPAEAGRRLGRELASRGARELLNT